MTVIEGAHDLEVRIAADGAGGLVNDEVARVALVPPLCGGDVLETPQRSGQV